MLSGIGSSLKLPMRHRTHRHADVSIGNPSSIAQLGRLSAGLVMVLIGFSLFANERARRHAHDIVQRANLLQERIHALQTDALMLERLSLERVMIGDPQLNSRLRLRIQAVRDDVVKLIPNPRIAPMSADESEAWLAFRNVLLDYRTSLSNILKLQDLQLNEVAREQVENELIPLGDQLAQLGQTLVTSGQEEVEEMEEQARVTREHANWLIGLGGVLTLALVLGAGEWGRKQIARREQIIHQQMLLLDRQNQELDAFAGRVAHDLRNLLSNILICLDVLPRAPVEQQSMLLDRGRASVRKMNEFLEALLEFSRSADPVGGRCHFPRVARQVAQQHESALRSHQVELRICAPPHDLAVRSELLESILRNLLSNAVKYLGDQPEPRISIAGRVQGGGMAIDVEDNGAGIPEHQLAGSSPRSIGETTTGYPDMAWVWQR